MSAAMVPRGVLVVVLVELVVSSILSEAAAGSLGPMRPNVGRPCEAPRPGPRQEEGPRAPGSAARREQRSGRQREPSAGSQLPARPLPKWRMRTSFARSRPSFWPWHPRLFRRGPGQLSFPGGVPAPPCPIPSSPSAPKREKERASPRPVLPSRYRFSSTTWRGVPWREPLLCLRSAPGCRRRGRGLPHSPAEEGALPGYGRGQLSATGHGVLGQ